MIDRTHELPIVRQCQILRLARSTVYYIPEPTSPEDLVLMRRIDERHLEHPFAGSRMLRDMLRLEGHLIGRKRVSRLMKKMRIEALYRKPNLSRRHAAHPIYRYLLRDLKIDRPNQVWATDISVPQQAAQEMRVWPLAIGLQERVANHHKRRWSKACVVSVMEKVPEGIRYGSRKTNNRELPFKCRKYSDDIKKRGVMLPRDQFGHYLLMGQAVSGIEAASA